MTLLAAALVFVFGLMIGSFLNVCIARIPAGDSIASPGSRCPRCRTPIAWHDNIPVVSYVILGGRCRTCRARISIRYPFVEVTTAALFVVQALWFEGAPLLLASRLVLTSILIVLFGTDLDTQRLPNVLTYPGLVAGLIFSLVVPPGLGSALIGAALGAGVLLGIRWVWFRLTGVDGMGLGDVKMLAMIGAFLGWQQVIVVLFLSTLCGAVVGVMLAALQKRSLQAKLPFGTFLAASAYLASLVGPGLVDWYLGLVALPR
jgi:leader peptidase (prepilin peptidase)/N-methyltransferase